MYASVSSVVRSITGRLRALHTRILMAAGMARACRRRRAKNSIGSANNSTHSRCECEELHYNKEEREGPQHSQPKPKASIDADGGLRMVGHVFVRARLSFGLGAWVHAGSFEVVSVG
mmetsp:Transcript_33022/g.106827  ORF Transcript_33022/g.106827 Transcript_33022/m.106827 type:complete len:117 (+) Transcript_33022:1-351(+)